MHKIGFLLTLLALVMSSCKKDEPIPSFDPVISIEKNKITSKYCRSFGGQMETDKDHLLCFGGPWSGPGGAIYVFKFDSHNIELIQTIDFNEFSTVRGMTIHNSTLAVGVAQYEGSCKVYMYERIVDSWEFKQIISYGKDHDASGLDIDISGEFMVIGAGPTYYPGTIDRDEGRVYIYRNTTEGWIQEHEFISEQSMLGDGFGRSVAIYNDFVFADAPFDEWHIYKYDETWVLLRTDNLQWSNLSHKDSNFFVYVDVGLEYELQSFTLEPDGDFNYHPINVISDECGKIRKQQVEIRENLALAKGYSNCCYLFKYNNNQWTEKEVIKIDTANSIRITGVELSDEFVILGAADTETDEYTYIYFINY